MPNANLTVCKGGGFVMQDAEHIRRFAEILLSDSERKVAVVSAPGSRGSDDKKMTDLLYECRRVSDALRHVAIRDIIADRFLDIMQELKLPKRIQIKFNEEVRAWRSAYEDALVSRGEYWSALILAEYLGWEFVDAHDLFEFRVPGRWEVMESGRALLQEHLNNGKRVVVPGFYGRTGLFDAIKLFPRNASDLSGALISKALEADWYEIWKDTPVRLASPKIVPNARVVPLMTYDEARELTYRGSEVVFSDAIYHLRESGTKIAICSLDDPKGGATVINSGEGYPMTPGKINGIASRKGFCTLTVKMPRMHEAVGPLADIFSVLRDCNIRVEHVPSSTDRVDIVVETEALCPKIGKVEQMIKDRLGGEVQVAYLPGLVLICVVGWGLYNHPAGRERVFKALRIDNVNAYIVDQSSDQLNIVVGVSESDHETAIRAIYSEFA